MTIFLVLFILFDSYLIYCLFQLLPFIDGGINKVVSVCLKPFFSQKTTGLTFLDIDNDEKFHIDIQAIVNSYSDLKTKDFEAPTHCFTVVGDFIRLDAEFAGSDDNLELLEHALKREINHHVFIRSGFKTPVYAFNKKHTKTIRIVSFLFALDDTGLQALRKYACTEKDFRLQDANENLVDPQLQEEFRKNGI